MLTPQLPDLDGSAELWRARVPAMPKWMFRTLLLLSASVWAGAMVVVGLLAAWDWPSRISAGQSLVLGGAVLAAAGAFLFAVVSERVFPLANLRVKAAFEVLPWAALVGMIVGGWL